MWFSRRLFSAFFPALVNGGWMGGGADSGGGSSWMGGSAGVPPIPCRTVDWGTVLQEPGLVVDVRGPKCKVVDGKARKYIDFSEGKSSRVEHSRVVVWKGSAWGLDVLCSENLEDFCPWFVQFAKEEGIGRIFFFSRC